MLPLKYAGYCIQLHNSGNEAAWRSMLGDAQKIGIRAFLRSCDLKKFQDGTENGLKEFLSDDPTSKFFESSLGNFPCKFIQTKGFEFIWTPTGKLPRKKTP